MTPTNEPQKVLVTGPRASTSSLSSYFTKLASLQSKHSFNLVIAQDLFSNLDPASPDLAALLDGSIVVPVQVYVAVGTGNLPPQILHKIKAGEEVCANVTILGKSGLLTLASGLKIATFGGIYDEEDFSPVPDAEGELPSPSDPLSVPYFTSTTLTSFLASLRPPPSHSSLPPRPLPTPDILLTYALPSSLPLFSAKPFPVTTSIPAPPLNELARASHAKYHFVGGAETFWEREPFNWPREEGAGTCRAISLAEMGNTKKERWFYAFSITPQSAAPAPPANATLSPFTIQPSDGNQSGGARGVKRPAGSLDAGGDVNEYGIPNYIFGASGGGDRKKGRNGAGGAGGAKGPPPDHYTCNICEKKGHWIQECPEKAERDASRPPRTGANGRPIQPDECWFCLSNPKVTKHLIAAIGSETYLTLPKGQLPPTSKTSTSDVAPVPGGGHVLLIPIAHYPTLLAVPVDLSVPIVAEMEQYKSALRACYAKYDASPLAFEVGRHSGKGGHAHIQICPVPNALAGSAEEIFRSEGAKNNIQFEPEGVTLSNSGIGGADNYFKVDLPDGKSLLYLIKPNTPFSLQFGRATVATILGIPERTDWKSCVKTDQEEKADCQRFKAAFKAFDPSL